MRNRNRPADITLALCATGVSPVPNSQGATGVSPVPNSQGATGVSPVPDSQSATGVSPVPDSQGATGVSPVPDSQGATGVSPVLRPPSAPSRGECQTGDTSIGAMRILPGLTFQHWRHASDTPRPNTRGTRLIAMFVSVLLSSILAANPAAAADPPGEAKAQEKTIREIFVPYEDLHVLLEGDARRVFLTRAEYADLLSKAKQTAPDAPAPQGALLLRAEYDATIGNGRVQLTGTVDLEVLQEGLHALPLELAGVGVSRATVDGQSAAIGQGEGGQPLLFVEGLGRHQLTLEMVSPLQTTAAQQSLTVRLPTPAATRMRLSVPGNVEVKSGGKVVSRSVDEAAELTRFELLLPQGQLSLVMSLNNRMLREQQVVVSRSVVVDEVTAAYERLHATVSLDVLHGAADRFQFALPEGFEPTDIISPLLARWAVQEADGGRVLEVSLREAVSETVVLNISAIRTPARLEGWSMPQLVPLDVAGHVAVVGLVVEDRLSAEGIDSQGLVPIDNAFLTAALPETVFRADPGAPRVRLVSAYYAPQQQYQLEAGFQEPPARLQATSNVLLILDDQRQRVRAGFALLPEVEKLFSIRFTAPEDWYVTDVATLDGTPLPFERYDDPRGGSQILVRLPQGAAPGQVASISFGADCVPPTWLGQWEEQDVTFPVFAVKDATRDTGAIAVRGEDDLLVRPDELTGLSPLDEDDKREYGLGGIQSSLAYRYEAQPYSATLVVSRTKPTLTARCFSFLQIAPEGLTADYEIVYDIRGARARQLSLLLPEDTPASLKISGLEGVAVKEFSGSEVGGARRWTALLAEPAGGVVRLAVHFEQPLPSQQLKDYALPLARADDVTFQSAVVAVEGSAELDIDVKTDARQVDVGELVAAKHRVGKRLLGVYEFVGAERAVTTDIVSPDGYGLPPVIVQRAELVTVLSASGVSQTAARYQLRTKAAFLEVELPEGWSLWSVYLDQKPVAPQRDGNRILLDLAASAGQAVRDLQIIYETSVAPAGLIGNVEIQAPTLLLRAEQDGKAAEVPAADATWQLVLPEGHRLVRSDGTVFTGALAQRRSPVWAAAAALAWLSGGVHSPMQALRHANYKAQVTAESASDRAYLGWEYGSAGMEYPSPPGEMGGYGGGYGQGYGEDYGAEAATPAPAEPMVSAAAGVQLDMPPDQIVDQPQMERSESDEAPVAERLAEEGSEAEGETPWTPLNATRGRRAVPALALPAQNRPAATQAGQQGDQQDQLASLDGKHWALEGVRSLPIDMQTTGDEITFQSLGVVPHLDVTITDGRSIDWFAWAAAVAVFASGVLLTRRSAKTKAKYVITVALLALAVPLATGLMYELGNTFDFIFYAACCLVLYYAAAGIVRWCACCCCRSCTVPAATVLLVLVGLACCQVDAMAQTPAPAIDREALIDLLAPPEPIKLPADAVIIPYNADGPVDGIDNAEKVLVPYEKYVELWNRAFPDQKLERQPPVVAYSLAGAAYEATLSGDEYVLLSGHVDIDVFVEKPVQVPLHLTGGVLASATIDGKPSRLQVIGVGADATQAQVRQQTAQAAPNAPAQMEQQQSPPDRAFALLQLTGKGRKRLELSIRLNLTRLGGWRQASGRLPTAPATVLTLTVPAAQTEVQLSGISDRVQYETESDNQQIVTALGADATLDIQWRPKVAAGQVDHSLTAESEAVLDVQEDGLRLIWQLDLLFPRSRRDAFTVTVPADYLVEKVLGDNVRGWQVRSDGQSQRLDLTLLKETADRERVTLHLSRRGALATDGATGFPAPVVSAEGAALHKGRLTVRRSPLLELRTISMSGPTRTDIPAEELKQLAESETVEESPLGLRPYQAFDFGATPFALELSAAPIASKASVNVQTVLRIAERETTLETRALVNVSTRPVHRFRVLVPGNLELDDVSAPGEFTWAITDQDQDRKLLSVYLAAGQTRSFAVVIRGSLGRRQAADPVPVPKLEVLDVTHQQGDMVVQIDPAFNVSADGLTGCETILLSHTHGWLQADQRRLARLALRYLTPQYDGRFEIGQRPARVSGYTISNVKVTDVALEETIVLDLTIQDAGIREVSFLLPDWMEKARVNAPMLRQKTVEDAQDGWKRFRLELQDEIIGQYRVLVENERVLLTDGDQSEAYEAPIPVVETGRIDQRFVTLENAGRDEVVVDQDQQVGLSSLGRQQKQWDRLAASLGDGITMAYLVESDAAVPKLVFATEQRKTVETAGASIGLGETLLVVDANGAYRGQQTYQVNNTTEQYLEVMLPKGAQLWTATVSGQPVKPTRVPGASSPDQARIPLIKTADGDSDYPVVLKYGGQLDSEKLRTINRVSFPFIHTVNINVELSQVRLRLPDSYRWFDFGGSMRQVFEEADYAADFLLYNRKQAQRLIEVWNTDNPYAKVRAANNLKQIGLALQNYHDTYRSFLPNAAFKKNLDANASVIESARQQTEGYFEMEEGQMVGDNRSRLNTLWVEQKNALARNVVNGLPGNFPAAVPEQEAQPQSGEARFNYEWLERNQLQRREKYAQKELDERFSKGKGQLEQKREELEQEVAKFNQDRTRITVQNGQVQSLLGDIAGKPAQAGSQGQAAGMDSQPLSVSKSQKALAREYYEQLEQQQAQMPAMPQAGESAGRYYAQQDGGQQAWGGQQFANGTVRGLAMSADDQVTVWEVPTDTMAVETHLASLDVDLPERGVEFMFRTTRGDIDITARSVSQPLLSRLIRLAILAAALIAIMAVWKLVKRIGPYLVRSLWAASLLILIALFSLLLGLFPVAALIALIVGVVHLTRLIWMNRRARQAAAVA